MEAVVSRVAEALTDPQRVTRNAAGSDDCPGATRADSLEGHAGVALFFAELARRDRSWLRAAHAHVSAAAQALANGTASVGLHMGPAAVLAAVQACAPLGGHYPRLRSRLVAYVADEQRGRVAAERAAAAREGGVRWASYDAIAGLCGTGRLLLTALVEGGAEERAASGPALRDTLDYFTELSRPVTAYGRTVPGWWVPRHLLVMDADREQYPRGEFNVGLAHGISGPLTLLALCAQHGVTVPGQDGALHRIGGWVAERALSDDAGPYWPTRIAFDDEASRPPHLAGAALQPVPRPSWCYGAPGVASALHQAGQATDTADWQRLARAALSALPLRDRAPGPDPLPEPIVCHGQAGLLQTVWRLGRTTGDTALLDQAATAGTRLLQLADTDAPFCFPPAKQPVAGILQGAAGIGASLLSLTASDGPDTHLAHWDRVLLLS
ncbi:putative Subtilin biosynthesis protein SpaC [Streptomyces aurantiacus JA 4570]|uniref:Putative Subtilin biosynthesis protein SpaC n=1 Tax=Streptomyces aurantiacus JA 4570 TaxID=1286094 RepID=S4AZ79_9ACTN|nr:putative Subtilin biosynthesis protein SpaC [Streptomyces aurantiacus JA 4570]